MIKTALLQTIADPIPNLQRDQSRFNIKLYFVKGSLWLEILRVDFRKSVWRCYQNLWGYRDLLKGRVNFERTTEFSKTGRKTFWSIDRVNEYLLL